MKVLDYAAILTVVFGVVCAQTQSPLVVKFDPSGTVYSRVGGQLTVTCELNRKLAHLASNAVHFIIKSAGGEVTLTYTLETLRLDLANYSIDFTQIEGNGVALHFVVHNVTDLFDGKLICRATEAPDITEEADVDIVIRRPIDTLRLKLNDTEPIQEDKTDPVMLNPGSLSITCVAEGSNPEASVHLYLNDKEVVAAETTSDKMDSNVTKYRTTLTASLKIIKSQSVNRLKCVAESVSGGNRSVEVPVKIIKYDPDISCTKFEAFEGQKETVLSCTVDYSGLDITGFKYSLGRKEYNAEGHHNDEFVQVSKEQLSENVVRVHLKLTESKDWHFTTEFYILVQHSDGHITRQSVRLNQIAGKSGFLSSVLAPVLIVVVVGWCVRYLMRQAGLNM